VTYRFLSPARQEMAEAVEYYERAAPGLGLEFLDEIERTVSRILLHPEAWTRVAEHHRRCRMRRFPYGLLYTLEQDVVIIAAVMNLRRHPDTWKKRL
jgi:plasmid stabilization system protein ParE